MPTLDIAVLETHRAALTGHCYRLLGSSTEAEDAAQETLIRAWKNLDRFEGRSSVRTWLYRIATNVCLDALSDASRRFRPMEGAGPGTVEDELAERPRTHWLEPVADARALPQDADPFELTAMRQSIRLAFVAALQRLPPRQRAALLLSEVLGWSAAEIADCLDMTVAAVNSALQRARATLARRDAPAAGEPLTEPDQVLLDKYLDAFHRYDVESLVSLLREDATFSMPPYALWLLGPRPVRDWLNGRGRACQGSRLVPTRACGLPAFAQYRPGVDGGPHRAWALVTLEWRDGRIASWSSFLDTERLFPHFGLPLELAAEQPQMAQMPR